MSEASRDIGALDAAIQRLDSAVAQLEARVAGSLAAPPRPSDAGLFDRDFEAELQAARARERELQEAGSEAARALGRAIAEIRAALGEDAVAAILDEEA